MASSSSQNNYDAIDLNAAPSAVPESGVHTSYPRTGPITVTDSVMLSGTTATAVAAGLFTQRMEDMGRHLHIRNHEVRALRSQVTILQRLLKDNKKKVVELKEENKELKKLVDSYNSDLVARSTEQSKITTELQKQYERLLVEVKELASRPIP
uniref:Uncharacterized protein n=1 Tax=Fagus sylvatica TaxID=28930 RepID=A0A2N9H4W0_FAGSY